MTDTAPAAVEDVKVVVAAEPAADAPATDAATAAGDDFSFSLSKKKKKKKKAVVAEDGAADLTGAVADMAVTGAAAWADSDRDYTYLELLERVNSLLRAKNPSLTTRKRHTLPPPEMARVGTRKTMWANFPKICMAMHRAIPHLQSFMLAELGTQGSIDGNQRLVLKGRFEAKQIESLLKKYIIEYVTCHMCRNPETTLTRDAVTRLYFIQCESCGSRRSVAPIRSGFHATSRSDRRAAKAAN